MYKRDSFLDVLKAIGIISIVLGHCASQEISVFAYLYHLMIFFFVAGYCISEKHISNPEQHIGKSLIKNGFLLIAYNSFFAVMHNVFIEANILAGTKYGLGDLARAILSGITLSYSELFLGAFWFIPVYIVAVVLFVMVLHICNKIVSPKLVDCLGELRTTKLKTALEIFACICILLFALVLNYKSITLNYHIQTSFLAIPVLFAGYYYKKYRHVLDSYVSPYGIIPSFLLLIGVLKLDIGIVELSVDSIINCYVFYPVTFIGIYFCVALGKLLERYSVTQRLFAAIGKCSFHIMALHFLCFKIVDLVYFSILNMEDVSILSGYPTSNFPIRWYYLFVGVLLPVVLVQCSTWLFGHIKRSITYLQGVVYPKIYY